MFCGVPGALVHSHAIDLRREGREGQLEQHVKYVGRENEDAQESMGLHAGGKCSLPSYMARDRPATLTTAAVPCAHMLPLREFLRAP